jgi:ABC-type transport system involved in multi-copper enzyme maturation permease subunit
MTTSPHAGVRTFYFMLACILRNLWVLCNLLMTLKMYGKPQEKSLITTSMLLLLFLIGVVAPLFLTARGQLLSVSYVQITNNTKSSISFIVYCMHANQYI